MARGLKPYICFRLAFACPFAAILPDHHLPRYGYSSYRSRHFWHISEQHHSRLELTSTLCNLPQWAKWQGYQFIGKIILGQWSSLCSKWSSCTNIIIIKVVSSKLVRKQHDLVSKDIFLSKNMHPLINHKVQLFATTDIQNKSLNGTELNLGQKGPPFPTKSWLLTCSCSKQYCKGPLWATFRSKRFYFFFLPWSCPYTVDGTIRKKCREKERSTIVQIQWV